MNQWRQETYLGLSALALLLFATAALIAPDSIQFLLTQTRKVFSGAESTVALFTFVLTIVAILQFLNNKRQLRHHEKVERAFVKMSHNPPGLIIESEERVSINVQIKNFGRTPARVTNVVLEIQTAENVALQNDILLSDTVSGVDVFLVADDHFNHRKIFVVDSDDIRDGAVSAVIIGYVDYVDIFGERHRAGYARQYRPRVDRYELYSSDEEYQKRNNLNFLVGNRYNFDRRRIPGEGHDWAEP